MILFFVYSSLLLISREILCACFVLIEVVYPLVLKKKINCIYKIVFTSILFFVFLFFISPLLVPICYLLLFINKINK